MNSSINYIYILATTSPWQDYDKYGIRDFSDKQALFRLIQSLNKDDELDLSFSPQHSNSNISSQVFSSPEPVLRNILINDVDQANHGESLLDLDAVDDEDDFLEDDPDAEAFSAAFMRSATPERLASAASLSLVSAASKPAEQSKSFTDEQVSAEEGSSEGMMSDIKTAATERGNQVPDTSGDAASFAAIADPPRIRVIVRKRPLNKKELERNEVDVLECDAENATLYVHEPKLKVDLTRYTECHAFRFDDVFNEFVDNDALYARAIRPLIATLFRAGTGTCFAYGQTGSGKTYTMQPLPLRAATDIFRVIAALPEFRPLSLHVACYEIYGGKVFDLLNGRQRLEVREDAKRRVQVVGLKELQVGDVTVLRRLCDHAACARSTGCTGANDESSRSHSIMTFFLRAPVPTGVPSAPGGPRGPPPRQFRPGTDPPPLPLKTIGKLSFIDLAGSERGADTYDNDKQTRLEGAEINKSLLALKECIRALDAEAKHIPFRGSKLTEVLRDSFMGRNARTVMIANVSPNSTSCEHTLNTLRYADRVKEIKKDGQRPGSVPTSARGAEDEDVSGLAALLHKLPPPSVPEPDTSKPSDQQALPATTTALPFSLPVPKEARRQVGVGISNADKRATSGTPFSPTKLRVPGFAAGGGTTPGAGPAPAQNGTRASANAVAFSPSRARVESPNTGIANVTTPGSNGSSRTSTSGNHPSPLPPSRRAGSISAHPLAHAVSDASQNSAVRSGASTEGVDDGAASSALSAAEEHLATLCVAHRVHIESTMAAMHEEMNLLSQLDANEGLTVEGYIEELNNLLVEKAASIAALQQQVAAFRKQLRAVVAAVKGG